MLARTGFYPFGDAREAMHRLMCSFDTTIEDVDGFLEHVASFSDGAEESKIRHTSTKPPIDSSDTGTSRGSHGRTGVIRDERFSGTKRSFDHR